MAWINEVNTSDCKAFYDLHIFKRINPNQQILCLNVAIIILIFDPLGYSKQCKGGVHLPSSQEIVIMTTEAKHHCLGSLDGISPAKPVSGATVSQVQNGQSPLHLVLATLPVPFVHQDVKTLP